MRKKLLFSMLLLFVGVSMQAQSIVAEQMDERFNDGTKMPYGWFAEGWTVKDGAIQTETSSGFSFDLESLMGDPEESKGDDPEESKGDNPEENKGDDPEENKNQFDISSLLESLMGGGDNNNYLLTPPLVVNEGESLVFSAKKGKSDDSGMGMSFSFGSSDSTFVVERTVYSRNQWVRVADLTLELDTIYKTFTIADTPAGEYRFRFKAGGTVLIDSVAGFHIDNEAPDLYIIENDARANHIDFSLCKEDSTRTLKVINTATGTLKINITSDDAALFSVSPGQLDVAAADSLDVNITFNFAAGKPGKNEAQIVFTPVDERVWGKTLYATAVVTQSGVWMEDFNANVQPKGFFSEGWEFHDEVATTNGGGAAAMFGFGSPCFLMTPPLKVESLDEVLLFSAKKGSGDDSFDMGSMFGGGGPSLIVEKSVYGSNKWERVKAFTEPLDDTYRTLWVGYIEPGEYRFRILVSDSIVIDSIAGFHLDENAPDIYVLHNNTAARAVNFGMPQANSTATFAVVNTGTGSLQGAVASTDETTFGLSTKEFAINASDTAYIDVTYLFDQESLGIHQGAVTFAPSSPVLYPLTYPLTAYSTYADAWTENFEPEYLREDETQPIDLPAGWETTGWEVKLPSSGGGIMDMFSGMMGGGDAAPKTYMASTSSDAYELITPRLQAQKGDVLRFEAELGGGGIMAMMGSFMGGGASGQLNVFYRLEGSDNWVYYDTFLQNGYSYFVAPYSGVYQLRFTSPGASLDNFYGFREPMQAVALSDDNDNVNTAVFEQYNGQTVNVSYDRNLSATQQSDGSWAPRAYVVSLPYDYDFTNYYEADQARIYRLRFKEEYYKQFIFLPDDGVNPNLMQAGRAYLVLVLKGQLNLSATGVTLNNTIVDDDQNVVNSFEDWYFEDKFTPVGKWQANFRSISDVEADAMNIYGLRDDGTWARFQSEGGVEQNRLSAFRGYFEADASEARRRAAAPQPGTYKTMFQMTDQQGLSTGENVNSDNLGYEPTIPYIESESTGIQPTLRAIDADGTSRYFDLQGRMLNGKPNKGVYIENGKKVIR
ncbi:MAG: hypothetical protein J6X07_02855 [Prevotella sp.]|nr:hypothetical protein [Prevotella sp.]